MLNWHIQEMKELRIPSVVVSTKNDLLLLIGEAKYKLVFRRQRKTFWMQNSKHVIEWRFSAKQLCHAYCSWQMPHRVTPSEKILRRYLRRLAKIPQANRKRAHILLKSHTLLTGFGSSVNIEIYSTQWSKHGKRRMWRTKDEPKNQRHSQNPMTLLTEINYTRTELIEYANEHNIYQRAENKRN